MMNKEKIYHLFNFTRCIKQEVSYNDKKFKVYIMKDSLAKVVMGDKILVTNDFFKLHKSKEEQLAVLFHEKYHTKITTQLKKLFYLIRFLSFKKANWQEEFKADEYSTRKNGKGGVLSFLKTAEKLYKSGEVKYNPKSHPPVKERIKRIDNLNLK